MMRKAGWLSCVLFVTLVAGNVGAQDRQLHWDELAVRAHLDAEGTLHVDEKQVMVFTGDWNGGERTFRLGPRHKLSFEGMGRIDPATGKEDPLRSGSLAFVDSYDWHGENVLRWRSRETSDPPFDNSRITYVLHYKLSDILLRRGDGYLLDHDFAFTDRDGDIERFTLELTVDPVWRRADGGSLSWSSGPIPPGKGYVVEVPLEYAGSGAVSVDPGAPPSLKAMLGSLLFFPPLLLGVVLLREQSLGRFARLRPEQVDRPWLKQNLLTLRPELVGALWDQDVGASEVSAVLARLVAEGKLKSRVGPGESMELELLVSRETLEGYERALIDALFFDGNHTSTAAVREHYRSTGFNPVTIISPELTAIASERLPGARGVGVTGWLSCLSFLAAAGILIYTAVREADSRPAVVITSIVAFILLILSSAFASAWGKRMDRGLIAALLSLIPAGIAGGIAAYILWKEGLIFSWALSERVLFGIGALGLFVVLAAISSLRSGGTRESIAARKMLTAAREYFRRELQKERPALDDAWFPYLLAFGLSRDVEKWSASFPPAASTMSTFPRSSDSSSSSSSSSSWSGGGGAFGGAGASGAWAAAAGGMAAAVASPSSSSGGSSGGGGGSSGGGGGGGW